MELPLDPMPAPIRRDSAGGYRVGDSRVALEWLIDAYNREGSSAEELLARFAGLSLDEVQAVLSYYEANKEAVDAYSAWVTHEEERAARDHERRYPLPVRLQALLRHRRESA